MKILFRKFNSKRSTVIKLTLLLVALGVQDFAQFDCLASTVSIMPQAVNSEVSYPPRLPVGMLVATATSDELIKPPSLLIHSYDLSMVIPYMDYDGG
jgi:hypothetical protein